MGWRSEVNTSGVQYSGSRLAAEQSTGNKINVWVSQSGGLTLLSSPLYSRLYSCEPCRQCGLSSGQSVLAWQSVRGSRERGRSWIWSLPTLIWRRATGQGEEEGRATLTLLGNSRPGGRGCLVVRETETGSSYCHADPVKQSLRTMWCPPEISSNSTSSRLADRTGGFLLTILQTTPCPVSLVTIILHQFLPCRKGMIFFIPFSVNQQRTAGNNKHKQRNKIVRMRILFISSLDFRFLFKLNNFSKTGFSLQRI